MIKNLKLNIKNTQLAGVLQKQTPSDQEALKSKPRPANAIENVAEDEAKPKANIIKKARVKDKDAAVESAPADELKPKRAKILAKAEGVQPEAKVAQELHVEPPKASADHKPQALERPEISPQVTNDRADQSPINTQVQERSYTPMPTVDLVESPAQNRQTSREQVSPQVSAETRLPRENRFQASPREDRGFRSTGERRSSEPRNFTRDRPADSTAPRDFSRPREPRVGDSRPPRENLFSGPPRERRYPSETRDHRDSRFPPRAPRDPSQPSAATGPREGRYNSDAPRSPSAPGSRPSRPPQRSFTPRESFTDRQARVTREQQERFTQAHGTAARPPRLGPTGKHFRDLVTQPSAATNDNSTRHSDQEKAMRAQAHAQKRRDEGGATPETTLDTDEAKSANRARTPDKSKAAKVMKKPSERVRIDTTRLDEDAPWRKRRPIKKSKSNEDNTIRPSTLHIRLPIAVKDLAQDMKLKASQLISKLFLQGVAVTLNDILDDETTIQLLGQEFGCEITIDTSEEERIRITNKSIAEEIVATQEGGLVNRPPVVAFMGHVDHGKTSLIDYIRKSNRVAHEAGAITQHIGAFSCVTDQGPLTILDTPGHEAFSAMRERGAQVTDVIVLVIAGDEGIKPQTDEAIQHAKKSTSTILVAINKSDKPNFNADTVYRQLAERELLPEVWGGKIITVNCSAVTGEGIKQLLEMIALQAEVLELKANAAMRARGTVIEAELHKGLGNVATVLVQNGTLRPGDALVFNQSFGRVKTMRDEFDASVVLAVPSQAVRITGLSSLPEAGEEFIVVGSEKEARDIAQARVHQIREKQVQTRKKVTMESLLQSKQDRKVLHCILRTDVQGSIEALRYELLKIKSDKVEINIVSEDIGEVSESDIELASASGAVIIGFHTRIEAHAEDLIKQRKVKVRCFDVIYHAVDGVRELMAELLDKIAEESPRGKAEVRAVFKSSHLGKIAGCQAIEGAISRSNRARVLRAGKVIWEGSIASLRRGKEDVREITKGHECGILLNGFSDFEEGDILDVYEITYRTQSL